MRKLSKSSFYLNQQQVTPGFRLTEGHLRALGLICLLKDRDDIQDSSVERKAGWPGFSQ
jgi:hypothetical protein